MISPTLFVAETDPVLAFTIFKSRDSATRP
ncbi:uncharacterized protein METZ01_LOCUS394085, partial [marine metagenome]